MPPLISQRPAPPRTVRPKNTNAVLRASLASWLLALVLVCPLHAQVVRPDFYITDGTVKATALSGNTLYIAGTFNNVDPGTGGGVPIDSTTGVPVSGFPRVGGNQAAVLAVAADGTGGWYIGGSFLTVGGLPRTNLAHVRADNTVADWSPSTDGEVRAIAVRGNTVFLGGSFNQLNGVLRLKLGAVDATTGALQPWDPIVLGNAVNTLMVQGTKVYVGGDFSSAGNQTRHNLAAVVAADGSLGTWNPNANGIVYALAASGYQIYAGGDFATIGGQSRSNLAELDTLSGNATEWNANATGTVHALAPVGSILYVGGTFANIGGQSRRNIAALNLIGGAATSWNAQADSIGQVDAIIATSALVYVGGIFSNIGGQARRNLAELAAFNAAVAPWNPSPDGPVKTLVTGHASIYVGGYFKTIGGGVQPRHFLAAVNTITGQPTAWNPNPNGVVSALEVAGGIVYAGGEFTSIGGQSRNHLAALDAATGLATAWNPNVNASVLALSAGATTLYAGGAFTVVGGNTRNHIAAISLSTGAATTWNPNADSVVFAVAATATRIYAGGAFRSIGGQSRNRIAALDAVGTGAAAPWNPNANDRVYDIALSGDRVYLGGDFIALGGQGRSHIAYVDTAGIRGSWNPNANGGVRVIAPTGTVVYVGGGFSVIGGSARAYVAAVRADTALATSWNPSATDTVLAMVTNGTTVFAGGNFTSIGGQPNSFLAAIDAFCEVPGTIGNASTTMPGPQTSTTGDFDGDHQLDLAVADASGAEVMLNDGGQFHSNEFIFIGSPGTGIATADLNHDGALDLAISTNAGFYISLGDRNAPGSFGSALPHAVGGASPAGIAIADLDHDGINDLVVALSGASRIGVLRGQGSGGIATGGFDPPVTYMTGTTPVVPLLGDFNGDGWWDVAVINSASNAVSIFQGEAGIDFFSSVSTVALGASPRSIALGDFDRDGIADLAVGTASPNTVKILRGDGYGDFTVSATYPTSPATFSGPVHDLRVADFDANGRADLAAVLDNGWIQYLYGDGAGSIGNGAFLVGPQVQIQGALTSLQVNAFATPDAPTAVVSQSDMNRLVTVTGWCTGGTARSLDVAYPNGGESVNLGDRIPIQWARNDLTVAVDVDISRDGGAHWERIASNQTGRTLDWTVAPPGTTHGRFRVTDSNLFTAYDQSNGDFTIAPLAGIGSSTLTRAALSLAYPNPTHGVARFDLALPAAADVDVAVFDLLGRRVQTLAHGAMSPGTHTLAWDGSQHGGARAGAGLYFVRARMPGFEAVRRVVRVE